LNVAIAGAGYVGLVTGACLAEVGNHVVCLDPYEKKIRTSNNGDVPMFEPGLAVRMKKCEAADYLTAFE
jgi:UDPglucose 6-dehydrogenase